MKSSAQNEFLIPFLGLTNGPHIYDFELTDAFISTLEKSSIEKGHFKLTITFDKQDRMVVLSIHCNGYYLADCDRCLAPIKVPMIFDDQVIIKVEEAPSIKKDEVYYLEPQTSHIDLTPFMVETIFLHLPMKNVRDCEEDEYSFCDQDVLKNLDTEHEEIKDSSDGNPWEELGKLNLQ